MNAEAVLSRPSRSWRWQPRRAAALAIVAVLAADLVLQLAGWHVLCKTCGDVTTHRWTLAFGALAWSGYAALERRLAPSAAGLLLGGLTGVHVALLTVLVAIPRMCGTCIAAGALACLAWTAALSDARAWRWALWGLAIGMAATHAVTAMFG